MTIKSVFPSDFLWGTATAAHQVEGNNINSDFWVLEHLPNSFFVDPSGDAIDHYHRYPEDIKLLAELGFNSYRFSIEWSRIEPEPGLYSQAVLDHYKRMLETCLANNLKPAITYHHFTSPRWLIAQGGWGNPETAQRFADYCAFMTRHLGDLIELICTINEVNVPHLIDRFWQRKASEYGPEGSMVAKMAQSFGVAPDQFRPMMFLGTQDVILCSHQQARAAIKSERSNLPVGMTIAMHDIVAVEGGEAQRDQARERDQNPYLRVAREDDFVGVQTYTRERYGPDGRLGAEEGFELTQMFLEYWPEALEGTIRYANEVAGVPVIVTENGVAADDDSRRTEYYQRALQCVENCLKDGLDVRGYYAWSAFDNFEWMLGYRMKFGLIGVNRKTQERIVKPSAHWLGQVAQAGGI